MSKLRVVIQMDPMEPIDIKGDSTFLIMLEAQKRGHTLFHYLPSDLSLQADGRVTARAHPVQVFDKPGAHFEFGDPITLDLAVDADLVLMRQDPPFDMAYISATHILEHLEGKTPVFNDPRAVRNAPEKLFVTHFHDLMPPTLISANRRDINDFRAEYKDIIIKPLYGNGGSQIFHIKPDSDNFNALLEMFTAMYREPMVVQAYLPAIRKGDKRIILIDGQPAGAVMRIPADGEARANLHVGGRAEATELTAREQEICERLGPVLREQGLLFTGIDVIGDVLTEINVTSPTGMQEILRLGGSNLAETFWTAIEDKL